MKPAVFLDRDGTMNRDVPYCSRPEDFELLPGVGGAVLRLNEAGFAVVVITNQSGLARGYFTEEDLDRIHAKLRRELEEAGGHLDAIYYCPHHPDEGCECRKPHPTLLRQAAAELDLDPVRSYVIGDRPMDMEMGRRAGCKASLLVAPDGARVEGEKLKGTPAFPSVQDAVEWLLRHEERRVGEGHERVQG